MMLRRWKCPAFVGIILYTTPFLGQVVTPFSARFAATAQGDIRMIGNMLETCIGGASCTAAQNGNGNNNSFNSVYVDIDGNPTTFNSSSADLSVPSGATVLFAGLYWGGRSNSPDRSSVRFSTPASGGYQFINGTVIGTGPSGSNFPYAGFADVTTLVQAGMSGTYTTANVQAAVGDNDQYAGWALVVVFGHDSEPARNLTVFDGFVIVNSSTAPSFTVSGFQTPPTGPVRIKLGAVAFEGDRNTPGVHFRLNGALMSDAVNPPDNFFNSTISDLGTINTARNPAFNNTLGFDIAANVLVNNPGNSVVPNGATSATLAFDTSGDVYYPAVATFATEVFAPAFTTTKTVTAVSGGGAPGSVLEYTLTLSNTGQDAATNTILNDTIPANTTYVPGSLNITSGANAGAKTDAAGDDQAQFDAAQNRVVFRLGTGANATAGGTLAIGAATTLKFRVTINPGVLAGTAISNQAGPITATGQVSNIGISAVSDANAGVPGNQPNLTPVAGAPDLTISKTHTGTFQQGSTGTYTIGVSNAGNAATSGTVTVSDPMPAGLTATAATGAGWTCTVAAAVTCTRSDMLAPGASYPPIAITVSVAPTAPASITNTATVDGGGDAIPGNSTSSDTASVISIPDLTITKTHTGNFIAGGTGTYTITVSNAINGGSSTGSITVSDPLPAGLTATAATGSGWACTVGPTVTCTRSDVLAPGNTFPPITLTVNIASNAPASIVNTATVAVTGLLGGVNELNSTNNTASDATTTVPGTDLSIAKSHSGNFTAGTLGGTYTIVVSNAAGATPSTGVVTVTDPLPAGLTATNAEGGGWNCTTGTTVSCTRNDPLAGGASYPPISLIIEVAANVPPSVTNTATVAGGGDGNTANNSASDTTPLTSLPDLSLTKTHTGSFTPGQSGTYTLVVSNAAGAGPTTGAVTVTDTLPSGLTATAATGAGWTCTLSATVTCTRSDVLAAGSSYPPITLTVNVAPNAPASFTNTASLAGGGDGSPGNNAASDPTSLSTVPDLSLTKTHTGTFTPGQTGTYTLVVSNAAGAGPTAGAVTVTDTLPTGLTATAATGAGWTCTTGPTVTCTRSDVLAPGASYPPITLTANVAADAPPSVSNTATVAGGGDVTPGSNTATDPTTIGITAPDLSLMKVHSGAFIPGQTGVYTLLVRNSPNAGPTVGAVTVTDTIPSGLTAVSATGTGWTCNVGPTVTCTRSDVLAPGSTYPAITITVNVAANAPPTVTNTATISGGGDVTPGNGTASDTTSVPNAADLSMTKSHTGTFTAGQTGTYTLVVSNAANAGPTMGAVTVTDTLPTGFTAVSATGDGWTCSIGPTVSCSRSDVLPGGASYSPITLAVNVAPNAAASVVNTATVSGGGDVSPGNGSASDTTSITLPSDLSMAKSHSGNLVPGQTATYSLVISNAANAGPTTGTVTVTDTLPPGIAATAAAGPGWSCAVGSSMVCSRSDALAPGANYPPITLTVNTASNASSTIINSATVDGGGDRSPGNNSGSDSGTPLIDACLPISATADTNFGAGSMGTFTLIATNPAVAPVSGRVVVLGATPLFAPPVAASGPGWDCGIQGQLVMCSRSDAPAAGAQFPPIAVTVQLANAVPGGAGTATFYTSNTSCTRPATLPVLLPSTRGPLGPEITLVTNAASFVTPGHVNYGIAPGSLVTIFGRGIGPATPAFMPALPLDPAGFAGVHVQGTIGNTSFEVPVFFASDGQLNVMLPSQTPLGDGSFVVTFNGASTPPFPIRVVRTNVGLFAPNKQGYGPGADQNAFPENMVVNNTLLDPVRPGQLLELWATGLGPVTGNEFGEPLPGSIDVPVEVYAGGKLITPTFAGRSGCCVGTDQIHFVFPEVEGCYVPVFVKAGGVVSNTITVASARDTHCADPGGLTVAELDRIQNGESLIGGVVSLNRSILPNSINQDYALATFRNLNLDAILNTEPEFPLPPTGSCTVGQTRVDGQGQTPAAPLYIPADTLSVFPFREKPNAYMSAGSPEITNGVTVPLIPDVALRYSALLGQSSSTFFDPGPVTVSNDQTTAPLGVLPESVVLPAAPQVMGFQQPGSTIPQSGPVPIIDRSTPLTVRWSGGDPTNEQAVIAGFKTLTSLSGGKQGTTATSWFVCTAPIDGGSYTVPSQVLQAMPTGQPITGPSGELLPWIPGGVVNDVTAQKSSLSIGTLRMPDDSRFSTIRVDFARLLYVLTTKQEVDYQ